MHVQLCVAVTEIEQKFRKAHLDQFITFKIVLVLGEEEKLFLHKCNFLELGICHKSHFMYLLLPSHKEFLPEEFNLCFF